MSITTYDEFQEQYLNNFTASQLEAVRAVEGPVLLLAVPGSGKTTVLVARLGYMTRCLGIEPESILTMTYTVAATAEMKQRFAGLFGQELADRMEFRTINGLSAKIIRHYEKNHGKSGAFRLLDDEGEVSWIVAKIYCDVTGERYASLSTVNDLRSGITYVKNMMLTDDEKSNVVTGIKQFPEIYDRYCAYLKSRRLMDYDDQMAYALLFLEKVPSLLEHFQNTYKYICVDEAQDTSKIQHEIIKLLASKSENLFMVGDEDQSIYGFRAAYPDALMRFEADHPGAKILLTEDNFRSTPEIVALANAFVAKNKFRRDKTIRPTKSSGDAVRKISALTRQAQFDYLFHEAKNIRTETAILYRNNDSALPLIDLFERNIIPYNCRNFDASFFSHRILNDVRAIVRFAKDPMDTESFMQIYYKFGFPLSKAAAQFACNSSRRTGNDILQSLLVFYDLPASAQEGIQKLRSIFPTILTASAERALYIIQNNLRYKEYAEQNCLDIGKFFVLQMLARNERSIDDLLHRLDELQVLVQEHKNSPKTLLTLSTIHSAKGLEFERVFLLDIIDGILPSKPTSGGKPDDAVRAYQEDRRLFYVAVTRAKASLYLFSCADSQSCFIYEAMMSLPEEIAPTDDVFSFLYENLLGKTFVSKENGKGQILAQCSDRFLIKYSGGQTELLSLSQMAQKRDTTVKYAPPKHAKAEKPLVTQGRSAPVQDFKTGKRIAHTVFGSGRIIALTTSGQNTVATITFDRTCDAKRFILQDAVKKGLLKLIN